MCHAFFGRREPLKHCPHAFHIGKAERSKVGFEVQTFRHVFAIECRTFRVESCPQRLHAAGHTAYAGGIDSSRKEVLFKSTGIHVDKRFGSGRRSGANNPLVGTRLFTDARTPSSSPFRRGGDALGLCLGLCFGFGSVSQRIFLSLKGFTWYSYTALL